MVTGREERASFHMRAVIRDGAVKVTDERLFSF